MMTGISFLYLPSDSPGVDRNDKYANPNDNIVKNMGPPTCIFRRGML